MGFKQPNFNKVLVLDTNRKPLDVKTKDAKITVSHKYCKPTHLMDGYNYA